MIAQSAAVHARPTTGRPPAYAEVSLPSARPASGAAARLDAVLETLARAPVRMSYGRDEEIFGEGEPADFVYRLVSGAVRIYRTLSDGRRQVCDFHLAGDYFGFEPGLDHRATAEAVSGAVVQVVRRSQLAELAARETALAGALWMMSAEGLQRSQDHVFMLGRKNAMERVAAFLVDFAQRIGARQEFELPMSRQDIADYLGLTIETVSRTFSQLEGTGVLKAHNSRRIRLCDRTALEDLAE